MQTEINEGTVCGELSSTVSQGRGTPPERVVLLGSALHWQPLAAASSNKPRAFSITSETLVFLFATLLLETGHDLLLSTVILFSLHSLIPIPFLPLNIKHIICSGGKINIFSNGIKSEKVSDSRYFVVKTYISWK